MGDLAVAMLIQGLIFLKQFRNTLEILSKIRLMEYNDGLAVCLVLVSKDFTCLPCHPRPARLGDEKACEVGEAVYCCPTGLG